MNINFNIPLFKICITAHCSEVCYRMIRIIMWCLYCLSYQRQTSWALLVKLRACECHKAPVMTSQHWFWQRAISWANVDQLLCHHMESLGHDELTHWGRVTHICVSNLTIIGSDNGLSPDRRQAIIWTKAGILLIGPLGTNFSEILIEILTFSFKKMRLKVSSAKRWPFCPGLNVLNVWHGWHKQTVFTQYSRPDLYMRQWTEWSLIYGGDLVSCWQLKQCDLIITRSFKGNSYEFECFLLCNSTEVAVNNGNDQHSWRKSKLIFLG